MTLANEALCKDSTDESGILTALFAVLDVREGTLTYTSGGHEPAIVRSVEGDIEELYLEGRVLGAFGGYAYSEACRKIGHGDTIIMVTGGITEARAAGVVLFGQEGVMDYLSRHRSLSPEEIADGLLEAAKAHAGGTLQDDAAVVVIGLSGKCD